MANEQRQRKLEFGEHRRRSMKTTSKDRHHRRVRRRDKAWLRSVVATP